MSRLAIPFLLLLLTGCLHGGPTDPDDAGDPELVDTEPDDDPMDEASDWDALSSVPLLQALITVVEFHNFGNGDD